MTMDSLLIRDMAAVERPRERLAKLGTQALKAEELLALVLRTGYKGHGAVEVSRSILAAHSLPDLLSMPYPRLSVLRGMGESRAAALLAAAELTRRADQGAETSLPAIRSVNDAAAQAIEIMDKKKEYLIAFFLNARHQLIAKETISIGTLTASLAHPREIFFPAIGKAAAGVILVHNHPSGDPSPSEEDIRLTKRIAQAGQIMGIELLDHLIVAEKGTYSFKTSGTL
jgi:DNA repair protein RadC